MRHNYIITRSAPRQADFGDGMLTFILDVLDRFEISCVMGPCPQPFEHVADFIRGKLAE